MLYGVYIVWHECNICLRLQLLEKDFIREKAHEKWRKRCTKVMIMSKLGGDDGEKCQLDTS